MTAPEPVENTGGAQPRYGGFWRRLAAAVIDLLMWSPLVAAWMWGERHYRLMDVYGFGPMVVLGFLYHVHLVVRYGGTPGKRLLGLRITQLNGAPVTFRSALIRYAPEMVLDAMTRVAICVLLMSMSDAHYADISITLATRGRELRAHLPGWYRGVEVASQLWMLSEFVVLLMNKRRRALHDYLAGTVVIRE